MVHQASDRIDAVAFIVQSWLDEGGCTLFCGDWRNGAIMELLPSASARLSPPRYAGDFAGLRDLRVDDGAHHVHLDLARLSRACYLIAPSVCYGMRPSYELRLVAEGRDPMREFGLGLSVRSPYVGGRVNVEVVSRYLARVVDHIEAFPDVTTFRCLRDATATGGEAGWEELERIVDGDRLLTPLSAAMRASPGIPS